MSALRGSRVGASAEYGTGSPSRRYGQVASRLVSFWCWSGHTTTVRMAADADIPARWPCGSCGADAGPDQARPPERPEPVPPNGGRTPLEYLQMRRTPEEGEQVLAEALERLRARREAD